MTSIEQIVELRKETGLGLGTVKGALVETNGDMEAAKKLLRERVKEFVKIGDTTEGTVGLYIHHNRQLGAMVELCCATDFNAKSAEFKQLADNIALHVAGTKPLAISPDDMPKEAFETEINRIMVQAGNKPEKILDRIREGAMKKFYAQNCLLNQPFVKDESKTIDALISEFAAKTGEYIIVKRFSRFAIGQ